MPKFKNLLSHRSQTYSTLEEDHDSGSGGNSQTQPEVEHPCTSIWNSVLENLRTRVTGWVEFDSSVDIGESCEIGGKLHLDFHEGSTTDPVSMGLLSEFDSIAAEPTSAVKGILVCLELNIGMYLKGHKAFEAQNVLQHEEWANMYIAWNQDIENARSENESWTEDVVFKTDRSLPATMNETDFNISYQVTVHCLLGIPEPQIIKLLLRNASHFIVTSKKLTLTSGHGQIMDPSRAINLDHAIGITGKLKLDLPKSEYLFGEVILFGLCIYTFLVNKFAAKTIKVELIQRITKRIRRLEESSDRALGTVTKLIEEDLLKGKEWKWQDEINVAMVTGAQPSMRYLSFEIRHLLQITIFNISGEIAYKSETNVIIGTAKKSLDRNNHLKADEDNLTENAEYNDPIEDAEEVDGAGAIWGGIHAHFVRKRL